MPDPIQSPDGRYELRLYCDRSTGVDLFYCPVLYDLAEDRVLFTLAGTFWSVEVAAWRDDSQTLVINLRRFSGRSQTICVRVDVRALEASLGDNAYCLPLAQLYERLEAWNQMSGQRHARHFKK